MSMEPKTVQQLRDLVCSAEIHTWHQRYVQARDALAAARMRREEPLVDTVLLAGEYDDLAAQADAHFAALDDSFEALSESEMQRQKATDAWVVWQGAVKNLEDRRQLASELRRSLDAAEGGNSPNRDPESLRAQLTTLESGIREAAAEVATLRTRSQEADESRDALWEQVQEQWHEAFRANMERHEHSYRARRIRAEANAMAAVQPPARPTDIDSEQVQATIDASKSALAAVLAEAEDRFDCVAGEEFLYWLNADDMQTALCVPLIDERDHLNVQVEALHLYQLQRVRGVSFIEPVAAVHASEDDRRLDAFFNDGRKPVIA